MSSVQRPVVDKLMVDGLCLYSVFQRTVYMYGLWSVIHLSIYPSIDSIIYLFNHSFHPFHYLRDHQSVKFSIINWVGWLIEKIYPIYNIKASFTVI